MEYLRPTLLKSVASLRNVESVQMIESFVLPQISKRYVASSPISNPAKKLMPNDTPMRRLSSEDRDAAIFEILAALDTPRSLAVWLMYSHGDHKDILAIESPRSLGPLSFKEDYLATKLLSKSDFLKLDIDRRKVALDGFWRTELQCAKTNYLIRDAAANPNGNAALNSLLQVVARKISRILGPCPSAEYFSSHLVGWGPGATSSCKGSSVSSQEKYQAKPEVTAPALTLALKASHYYDLWSKAILNADALASKDAFPIVRGNKLNVVPKNAKTDRVICIEPHVNALLQKGVGSLIRRRLKSAGCDLNDQTINQRRARLGSIDGSLATLDLASASDTIAYELVWALLPYDWAELLSDLRSPYSSVDEKWVRLEKFSSMGNGYTFELESLIFFAVCQVFDSTSTVYGDDIIVSSKYARVVVKALELLGFSINLTKSFLEGPFRESCGGDYYCGVCCSPIYVKSMAIGADLINLHNRYRQRSGVVLQRTLVALRGIFPARYGPEGYGDYHYHVNWDEATPKRCRHGIEGWNYKSFIAVPATAARMTNGYAKLCADRKSVV